MRERSVDLDGIEVEARTAFGKAQLPLLAVLCSVAIGCILGAGWLLIPSSRTDVSLINKIEHLVVEGARETDLESLSALRRLGSREFERCRTAQLLDDVSNTRAPPYLMDRRPGTIQVLLDDVDFTGVACRPESWLGPGSQLDALPPAIDSGIQVENPLWPSEVWRATPEALAEAEMALWHRLKHEYELIELGPSKPPPTSVPVSIPTPQTVTVREDAPLGLVMGLVGTAVLLLFAVFGFALVPDRQRFRFDLRGVTLGDLHIPADRVSGVWVENGRLVVEEKNGTLHRSSLLDTPEDLEPLIAQYQRLSTVTRAHMPANVRRLMGKARKE